MSVIQMSVIQIPVSINFCSNEGICLMKEPTRELTEPTIQTSALRCPLAVGSVQIVVNERLAKVLINSSSIEGKLQLSRVS